MKSRIILLLLIVTILIAAVVYVLLRDRKTDQENVSELMLHRNLGLAYLEEGQLQEAEKEFQKLTELAPEEALGYANLAIVHLRSGKYGDAEIQIQKALELSKDSEVRMILAEIYEKSGKEQEALGELQKILNDNPNHLRANFKTGQIYARSSNFQKVEEHFNKVVESAPANLPARLQLIEARVRNGNAEPALAELELVRQLVPEFPANSVVFYDQAHSQIGSLNLQDALTSVIAFHNTVKPIPMYQAGVFELSGPGSAFIGTPIVHFSNQIFTDLKRLNEKLPVEFQDVSSFAGLDNLIFQDFSAHTSSALNLIDFDGDGDPDIYAGNLLLRNDRNKFFDVTSDAGIDSTGFSKAAASADFDNDADQDLYLIRNDGAFLYQNQGNGRFLDVTDSAGLNENSMAKTSALFIDLDIEGDLDLFILGDRAGAYRNNFDGSFSDISDTTGLTDIPAKGRDVAIGDFDEDGDVDLIVVYENKIVVYSNLRQGRFEDVTAKSGLKSEKESLSVATGDYNNDGFLDLFIAGAKDASALWKNKQDGTFEKDSAALQMTKSLKSIDAVHAVFFDFNNDGFLDIAVAGKTNEKVMLFRNDGTGKFDDVSEILPPNIKSGENLAAADYDLDGDVDLFLIDAAGKLRILRNEGGNANRWLSVQLVGLGTGSGKNNRDGIGAKIEVKAGDLYQMRIVSDPVLHFGLGSRSKADVIRIIWTNGVPQNHILPNANQRIVEKQILKGSCFFLYAWNGTEYKFVTDIMWRSALGMPLGIMGGTRAYAFSNSTDEYLKVSGKFLQPRNGRYSIQITEELWETAYLDKARLVVIDHPESIDIFVDERFVGPPYPELRIFKVSEKILPVSAIDDRGNDLLPLLSNEDERYVANLKPAKYQGVTEMHDLILDLGDFSPNDRIVLFLKGWIYPSDASINVSISQSNETKVAPPFLQVSDTKGNWQTVIPNLSFPTGKNKTIVADLTGKFLSNDHRVRIRTNMEIYWDHIFFSRNEPDTSIRQTTLMPVSADLHYRGFSEMYRNHIHGPHLFDYSKVTSEPKWRDLEGNYTRYGDVNPLLMESDNRYVIVNSGDEVTIQFDEADAPPLPKGWSRDFLIYTDGWIKDGDLNTAHSKTVDPLPFHTMTAYPYPDSETYPLDEKHQEYLKTYNTRKVYPSKFRKLDH